MIDELKQEEVMSETNETPDELIKETIDKVSNYLTEFHSDHISFGDGSFTVSRGSSQTMIIVRPFTKTEACVECIANVVTGANITPNLMRFLLRKNSELHFGGFGLLFDDTITFSRSFSSSAMDSDEFKVTLNAVAIISDYYDDIIVDLAGGKRARDILDDLMLD